jgi:hypothetical protein
MLLQAQAEAAAPPEQLTTVEAVRRARELIADYDHWTTNTTRKRNITDHGIVEAHCVLGAFMQVAPHGWVGVAIDFAASLTDRYDNAPLEIASEHSPQVVTDWNDRNGRSRDDHERVLYGLDSFIAANT